MSVIQRFLIALSSGVFVLAGPAQAQSCKPDQAWHHQHSQAEQNTISTDVKGSRATRIEVCRDEVASGAGLQVFVLFAGVRTPTPLAQGQCADHFTKWAIIRSIGVQAAAGTAAEGKGVYRVCKE